MKSTMMKAEVNGPIASPAGEQPRVMQAIDTLGREVHAVRETISTLASRLAMVSDLDAGALWEGIAILSRESVVRTEAWLNEILSQVEESRVALNRIIDSLHI